ncbi:polysaccharide lyase [Streptomyces sp. NBC_00513]|uniref:polysaccharide lyase n=1 Tax=unclassified Streptomyces TaxID=2593676 RepID=UPI00224CFC98|nr:polysaccharide lyase [Streptomyces sp. NBC_00424]MCX5071208.1 polysaccharide lyase [Streptomyces sp. NBC_00424]WUD45375.1 polysaccharide lyase [Streptomyces sp. NBC_00513]
MFQRYSRTRRFSAALAAVLVVGLGATDAFADRALTPLPFKDGFESGATSAFPRKGIDGTGTVDVKSAPGGRGGKAVRFAMPDDGKSYRTEIATARVPYGSYRYTFANYLPNDWIRYDAQTIVSQWHGGTGTYPAVVLAVKNDRWMMVVHWRDGSEKVDESRKPAHEVKYDLGPVQFGHWNQWSFDITWSTKGTTGSITARLDGAQVGSHHGPNSYHQDTAPYHKIGLYRPNWQAWKGHKAGGTPAVVNYYDDVTISAISPGAAAPPATSSAKTTPPSAPDASDASASPAAQAPASAQASAPTLATGPAAPGSTPDAADDIPMDTGSDQDTDNNAKPLAETGASSQTPIILAFGSALLAAGIVLVLRGRARVARLLAGGRRG